MFIKELNPIQTGDLSFYNAQLPEKANPEYPVKLPTLTHIETHHYNKIAWDVCHWNPSNVTSINFIAMKLKKMGIPHLVQEV